jgi:methyltransferase-like protein/2-polyprenyl-3-methyl-5-hydroxy-6-metoxy-1,4-benzoquinol methylase
VSDVRPQRAERPEEASVRDAYDRVPYPSGSVHTAHPDNLATRALLFGLEPPDLRRVRVLELGCADGGNLIAMASELPEGRFLGVDLSPRQIADGRRRLEAVGIANVELRAMSLLDVDASLGEFDYVVAHGVFSWVGPEVQESVLRICRENLAPAGVAYVSYNTFPGWHQRLMVREMMLFHTRGVEDLLERGAGALDVLELVAGASTDDLQARFLRARLEHLAGYRERPSYVIHEYLEESNAPLYFHQLMARAGRHGLQYVADAETGVAEIETLPPEVAARLRGLARDRVELEQYLDFVVNRTFRRSLLCHAGAPLGLAMVPERMRRLHAASPVRPESATPDLRSEAGETFRGERDRLFAVSHPATKAVLVALSETWPRALAFGDLLARAGALLGSGVEEALLADILFSLYGGGFLDLHLLPPVCVERVSERPAALPLARREATLGSLVTNAHRRILKLDDDLVRILLLHLDGTRDRAALREVLAAEVEAGRLAIAKDGEPVRGSAHLRSLLDALLEQTLRKMAGLALLVA